MNTRILCALGSAFFLAVTLVHQIHAGEVGTVFGWGWQAVPLIEPGARFTAIDIGTSHSLALKADGTVVAWGEDYRGQCTVPADLRDVVTIAAGASHSLAV